MGESAGTGTGKAVARLLPGYPPSSSPVAMGWSTVAVEYHYSDQRTAHTENERSRYHVPLILSPLIVYLNLNP